MTVSNTNNTMRYTGGGGTTLPYTFQIYANTDLVVKKVLTSTGAETLLVLTTDYTVDGVGVSSGGNVYLISDPGATYTIVIQRSLGLTQGVHYVANDPFPSTSHETALDRLTFISQQIQEQIDRCVKIGSVNSGITLTLPKPTAGASIGWSSDGLSLINITPDDSAAAASAAAAASSAATASSAASAAAASAALVNLPSIVGQNSKLLQVKSDASGYQFISTLADSLLATISTAGKVAGSALTSLTGVPSGAGQLPPVNGGVPTGVYYPYAGASVPAGHLLCDGSAVSRTTYAALFTAIGVLYGAGDASTTFNVPDMRERVPVGYKSGSAEFGTLGQTGGEKTHQLTVPEMPAHTHKQGGINGAQSGTNTGTASSGSGFDTQSTGGDGAHNNIQPYQVGNFIIKT